MFCLISFFLYFLLIPTFVSSVLGMILKLNPVFVGALESVETTFHTNGRHIVRPTNKPNKLFSLLSSFSLVFHHTILSDYLIHFISCFLLFFFLFCFLVSFSFFLFILYFFHLRKGLFLFFLNTCVERK